MCEQVFRALGHGDGVCSPFARDIDELPSSANHSGVVRKCLRMLAVQMPASPLPLTPDKLRIFRTMKE